MTSTRTIALSIIALLSVCTTIVYAQHSVLSNGKWFKMGVEKEGLYKIDFELLKKMGIDPAKTDPRNIRIYGNEGGMLPQANNAPRPADLTENAIQIVGEEDGKFDKGDFILFYAQGPDKAEFIAAKDIFRYEHNLYSNENYYFITVADSSGKRVSTSVDLGRGFPAVNTFNDFIFHEKDEVNVLQSGREWYGEKFGLTNEYSFPFSIPGIAAGSTVKMVSDVVGQSTGSSSFQVSVNGVQVADQKVLPISTNSYGVKGIHKRDTIIIQATAIGNEARADYVVRYEFVKGQGLSQGHLDFFLLSFERVLALYGKQTIFTCSRSVSNAVSLFNISGVADDVMIWDVTNPYDIKLQDHSISDGVASFATSTSQLKKFVVSGADIPAPVLKGAVPNQNLHDLTTPEMVIVAHPSFLSEAYNLANHRLAMNGWQVAVVTPEQVYNEFSSGRQDVSAIRDFVRHLRLRDPNRLKALLLFGKGSYDYKNRLPRNSNFVVTYESRNSLHPLQTFSSDDYFAFLEDNEGGWGEEPSQAHTLDIAVGRLPVMTVAEAKNVVDKIIDYETAGKSFGSWRKEIVFVADDGNTDDGFTSLHQYQADQLAEMIEDQYAGADTRKLFMGAYAKTLKPNGETTPRLTDDVIRAFEKGSLIINYTGHGSERQWGDENFFNEQVIDALENKTYPFLVTATCEFGRHDNPMVVSSAEKCVTMANGGAIGMVTTARPVNASTNFNLNEAFYEALFQRNQNGYSSIGEVFRHTKNNSTSGVANRNFSLLADPSMTLALPPNQAVVTSIKTATGSDTIKALSKVIVTGEIRNFSDELLISFNGILEATLFDKPAKATTIGRNNPAFTFNQWSSALFRGKVTVKDGRFEMTFIVPKNISYQVAQAKFSLYAYDPVQNIDASGYSENFKIGGSEPDILPDAASPAITLFIGDTTFINGGFATPDTYLVAHLEDDSGINISSYGIGNSVIAILDDNAEPYILNDYYVADTDNFTSGWIRYPIKGLAAGRHTLTVKAWDVHNNYSVSNVDFVVTEGEALVIESFGNYPNPFTDKTTLFFTHNRSGDDLQAQLFIQNVNGQVIKSGEIMLPSSEYRVDLLEFSTPDDSGKKLSAGLYLARLIVRSLSNGSKYEQVTKLIILN